MINFLLFIFLSMAFMNLIITPFSVYCAWDIGVDHFFRVYLFTMALCLAAVIIVSPFVIAIEMLNVFKLIPVGVF